jgi:DNA-binding MarR family transcriptional regulator
MHRRESTTDREADAVSLDGIINLAEFRAALRLFQRRSEEIARRWALTPQRYLLLLMIKGAPDGSQRLNLTQIAERLQLSRNGVTELAARAEEAGLVERRGDEVDQRLVYLRLTPEGERRLRGAVLEGQVYRDELSRSFSALTRSYRALPRGDPGRS